MEDKLIRATAKDGMVRIIAAITTNLVNEGTMMHEWYTSSICWFW